MDGTVIMNVGSQVDGITGIAAIAPDVSTLWTGPGSGKATIAKDGTVIWLGGEITAIDGATGDVKWQLSPPSGGACIIDGALTSEAGLMALGCGARD